MADAQSSFMYVTYIRSTPEKVWAGLTDPAFTKQVWFGVTHDVQEWKAGASWGLKFADGRIADTGEILECDPPHRLVLKWRNEFRPDLKEEGYTRCTITIEPADGAVKLSILHEHDAPKAKIIEAVSTGWPKIVSNLKSLLETGELAMAPAA